MTVEPTAQFRRQAYRLLTVVAVAMVCAPHPVGRTRLRAEHSSRRAAARSGRDCQRTGGYNACSAKWNSWPPPVTAGRGSIPNGPTRTWATRPTPSPTFSSNDRSRWAMVRALVDNGTFAIGRRTHLVPGEPPRGKL